MRTSDDCCVGYTLASLVRLKTARKVYVWYVVGQSGTKIRRQRVGELNGKSFRSRSAKSKSFARLLTELSPGSLFRPSVFPVALL